jgi:hypothetical protein
VSEVKGSAGRRLSVITIDQALAGSSNLLIALAAAHLLRNTASFGLYSAVFLVYVVSQGFSRALICDPLLVHTAEAEKRPGEIIGASVLLGLVVGALLVVAGFVARPIQHDLGGALVVLGWCTPFLMFQDLGRYLGFAIARPGRALLLDGLWLGLLIPGVALLVAFHARTLTWFIIAWAGCGAVCGLLLFWQYRGVAIRPGLGWLRYTWHFSWRYMISYSATQGAALLGSTAVGVLAGAKQLGGVSGTILLARPFGTFQIAAVAAGVSEIDRTQGGKRFVRAHGQKTSLITTVVAAINAAIMLALPDKLGRAVIGHAWEVAKTMLLPTAAQLVVLGLITGARAGLLGSRAARKTVKIDVASTVLVLSSTATGAALNGAIGALWGVAIAQGVMAIVWWIVFLDETSHQPAHRLGRPRPARQPAVPPAVTVPTPPSA